MDIVGRGIIAGFLATLALSAVLDPMMTAARMADVLPPTFGWVLHFFVGSFIWGAGFALLQPLVRGPYWLRGLAFGVIAWLLVMVVAMPRGLVPVVARLRQRVSAWMDADKE
jgi:hypothetical protein